MSRTLDWTIRVRHQSYRTILPAESEKIDTRLGELYWGYENSLTEQDFDCDILTNCFTSRSFNADDDMHEAMRTISLEFPEFIFQTESVDLNHEGIRRNYYRGDSEQSYGFITYQPSATIRF